MNLCQAIARMTGFGVPGSRPTRNNNPGGIEWGKFAQAHGADRPETGNGGRFAHFPTPELGFACLKALLQCSAYAGLTVERAINKYAPPCENETTDYVRLVCEWTGMTPDAVIDEYL